MVYGAWQRQVSQCSEDLLDAMDGIACAVDAENRLIAVGHRRWDRFAIENSAPELRADSIVGRNLFEFVSGPGMRQAYRDLADRIVSAGEPALIAARCDRPGVARELRLSVAPLRLEKMGRVCCFRLRSSAERRGRGSIFSISRPC